VTELRRRQAAQAPRSLAASASTPFRLGTLLGTIHSAGVLALGQAVRDAEDVMCAKVISNVIMYLCASFVS
jgi:hypothetical protein